MKYQANPVIVDAEIIISTNNGTIKSDGSIDLVLQNGITVNADKGMISRYIPQEGDYWVTQSDGYIYLNPKEVFERKYSSVEAA